MLSTKDLECEKELDEINQIWLAVMQMNIYLLDQLLYDDIKYTDIGKEKLIEKLGTTFQDHKTLGDSEFYMDLSFSNGYGDNQPVCKFIGNNSGMHFGLIFEFIDGNITDIYYSRIYDDGDDLPF